jgi:multidrug efflux pump
MILSDVAVKKRISVMVMAVIILLVGLSSYLSLPREDSPDITIPHVFVETHYKGVSSEDIETSITIKIEKKLKGLDRVKNIKSNSSEGISQIDVEFIPGTDIDEVLPKVKDKVDEAKPDLPSDLTEDPSVYEVNFSEMPIVTFAISGTCGPRCLKRIADDLKDDIEAVPGVLEVVVTGGRDREIRVELDADKLAYYHIPITKLQQVVSSENQNTSGGAITLGDGRYQLRVPGEFKNPEEILMLIVATHEGRPVYLKDVARVTDGLKDEESRSRIDGVDSVNIAVKKRVGENIIAIADRVDEVIAKAQPTWPHGTQIIKLMDKARDIRLMVADLENNIITGLILVVVVLLFAMGLRNAVLVSMAIPFSMFLSFTVLQALGITLNMVVLFSLTLALGMLVDNAIVIVENVYRYMEQGVPRLEAAMRATGEVAWPVIGSTLTTLAAFAPLLFWPGIMGEFMKFLPITLLVTLTSSLIVAMVINPALCAIFMKIKGDASQASPHDFKPEQGEKPITIRGPILKSYAALLRGALKHKLSVLGISFCLLIILYQIWFLGVGLKNPIEFFPPIDPTSVIVNINPPEGADLDYVDKVIKQTEMAISGHWPQAESMPPLSEYAKAYQRVPHQKFDGETFLAPTDINNIEHIYSKAVQSGGGFSFDANLPNQIGIQFLKFEDRKTPTTRDLDIIRQRTRKIAGAQITVAKSEEGPPTGAPINIEVSGKDFTQLGAIAKQIRAVISKIPHVEDVRDDFVGGLPSVRVRIDRQKAALYDMTTDQIGSALKTAYNGLDVSTFYEGDDDYDIVVTLDEKDRKVTDVLHKLMIPTPTGTMVPLTTLADIDYSGSLGDIVRINHNRVVTVEADVNEAKTTGAQARVEAEKLLAGFSLPAGYAIKFTGEDEFQKESEDFLSKAFMIAIFLIFLILVTLFDSVAQPLIILTSVILSLGGAFFGLFVIHSPFGIIMSGVGFFSLAGVVVNNAIVLIDYTNKLRERGMDLIESVVAAGATRLRPVLLTAITTILGLVPMITGVSYDFHKLAISWSSQSTLWWRSMATIVIFGLIIATVLTLVVVPTLYALTATIQGKLASTYRRFKRWRLALDDEVNPVRATLQVKHLDRLASDDSHSVAFLSGQAVEGDVSETYPKQHSGLGPIQRIALLLTGFFSLLALSGYWFVSSERKAPPPKPDVVKVQTYSYKCKTAEPCHFALPQSDRGIETSKLVQAGNLPKWLTFDKKGLYFNGKVPPSAPNRMYAFKIYIKDHNADKRLLQVKLKIDEQTPSQRTSPAGKAVNSQHVDQGYLLKKLLDHQKN